MNKGQSDLGLFSQYYSFLNNDQWALTEDEGSLQSITAMYYAFTTLSKVGLGDFYPVTDAERLLCSLIFTGCIAVFSVIVDELGMLMLNLSILYGDIDGKEGLEQFLDVIKVFNQGK